MRIECCRALGKRAEAASVASLATALRGDKNADVKLAAAKRWAKSIRPKRCRRSAIALDDRDPAMQYVGVQSLKSITGKDYGPDVQAWRQVAAGGTPPARSSAIDRGTHSRSIAVQIARQFAGTGGSIARPPFILGGLPTLRWLAKVYRGILLLARTSG